MCVCAHARARVHLEIKVLTDLGVFILLYLTVLCVHVPILTLLKVNCRILKLMFIVKIGRMFI